MSKVGINRVRFTAHPSCRWCHQETGDKQQDNRIGDSELPSPTGAPQTDPQADSQRVPDLQNDLIERGNSQVKSQKAIRVPHAGPAGACVLLPAFPLRDHVGVRPTRSPTARPRQRPGAAQPQAPSGSASFSFGRHGALGECRRRSRRSSRSLTSARKSGESLGLCAGKAPGS